MRLLLNTANVQYQVSRNVQEKLDGDKRQKRNRDNLPMWSIQLIALDSSGAEVINVTVAAIEKPAVSIGQFVTPVELEALPWNTNGKHGVAFRATELKKLAAPKAA
ncbi:hypothetical protein [Actinocatenispora rupis]|uniref:Putative regulatory protein n=1 Tax=Actinocatenispora rupis TaxID=519421 RepID=A0A8J3NEX1_9ACTN|nr:hypothetical protein [Actinocatenispora rupis]GID13079.1 putative regulatory protein [Actinocatenispora rupis]